MMDNALALAVRPTLLAGGYNLLVGSGISLDSTNGLHEPLRNSEELRKVLCALKAAPMNTTLSRVASLLTDQEKHEYLVRRYSSCSPGKSVQPLCRFLWRRLFSLNIDDVVETLYADASRHRKQSVVSINYDSPLEPTPNRDHIQVIHLHGWVGNPASDFVFSTSDYARVMRDLNPWMHLLAEILATEPFIIAGTSLNEPDLEFYLSHRSPSSPRRGQGPSLLIEPHPDVATEADCRRHGLTLVRATFGEFLGWLGDNFPNPPTIQDLLVPDVGSLFSSGEREKLKFFSDFELIPAGDRPLPASAPPFLYGGQPTWRDLDSHVDIEREANAKVSRMMPFAAREAGAAKCLLVLDEPGTGKSTVLRRVGHDAARSGKPVLALRTLNRMNVDNAIRVLETASAPVLVLVDNLADHVEQVAELLEAASLVGKVTIVGAERSYRKEHLEVWLRNVPLVSTGIEALSVAEAEQLIERYRGFGLIGHGKALEEPRSFARRIANEPVAIAVCRILNDFQPVDTIVDSLWDACPEMDREIYSAVALAQYCYSGGLLYSIGQSLGDLGRGIGPLLSGSAPLRLAENPLNDEYVVPMSAVFGIRLLHRLARDDSQYLEKLFTRLANAVAPHVSIPAIKRRSPEARLAGRVFDYDKVVKPLIGGRAESFYLAVQEKWAWNSRYWEQRALLAAETDLRVALQHARHAVALEKHSFTLTTLAKILLDSMDAGTPEGKALYEEAFRHLENAIQREAQRHRSSVHPFGTLLTGTIRFLDQGGRLSEAQRSRISGYAAEAKYRFANDPLIESALSRLDTAL